MKIPQLKYLKYLFWFGPILTVAGITLATLSESWGATSLGLVILGIVIIALWLIFISSGTEGIWNQRATQVGTNALISTLAVMAILGMLNFLSVRYAVRLDLTETKLFTLAKQSQEVVKNLQKPVKVLLFEREVNPADRALLESYRRYSSQFSFEFIDPQVQLGLAQKFGVQSPPEVHLELGEKRQFIQSLREEALSEVKLTNAIEQLTSDRTDKIYFLQGHRERSLEESANGLSQALAALKNKSFIGEPLTLTQKSTIPKDAAVIVVAGPKQSLFKEEEKALREYLNKGGSLLLMVDPSTNPGLDNLLKEWGVKLDNRLAVDASGAGRLINLGPATPLITNYGQHPITKDFSGGISFYQLARPIDVEIIPGIASSNLLVTDERSWAESDLENKQLQFNPESDRPGPLTIGVALNRPVNSPTKSPSPTPETENKAEPRLVVLGNSSFATNSWFSKELNGDVFLNSVTWLSKRDAQVLSIRPKEQKNRRINLTAGQAKTVGWLALAIVPFIGFAIAAIIWWLRR